MAKGINIGIASDTRDFDNGIRKGIIDPLDDAAKALGDLDKKGDLRTTERGLESAQDASAKLRRELDDVGDKIRSTGRAGKNIGDDVKSGTDRATDGIKEIGDESASTAKEAAASFDGSAESIADAFQEVAANAFAGFGPAGLIAGVAAAAGIGLIISEIENGTERGEEFKAKISELSAELIEAGKVGGPSIEYVADKLKELATNTKDGTTSLQDLKDAADGSGSSFKDLAQAYAGSTDKLDELIRSSDEHYKQLEDEASQIDVTTDAGREAYNVAMDRLEAEKSRNGYLREASDAATAAAEAEANWAASGGPEMEVKADLIQNVADAYDGARDAAYEAATADGSFNIDEWLTFVEEQKAAVEQYKVNLESLRLTPEQWENFLALPDDAQRNIAASFAGASDEGKARIVQGLTDAGSEAGSGAAVAFDESFGKPDAEVAVTVETSKAKADVEAFVGTERKIEVKVEAPTEAARSRLDDLVRNERVAVIRPEVRTAAAYADLNNLIAEQTATIRVKYVDNASGKVLVP